MDVDCAVMTVVKRASMALTGAQLARGVRLELGRPVKKAVFEESLARVVSEGEIREVQGLTKGKKSAPAYTALGDAELSAAWLEPRLGSGARPVKVTGLRAKLPAVLVPRFEEAIQLLLERGALYEWPAKPGWVLGRKPQPSDVVVGARVKAVTALLAVSAATRPSMAPLPNFSGVFEAFFSCP